jgi:hypothetical protein
MPIAYPYKMSDWYGYRKYCVNATALNLCYSSVSYDELCCGTSTPVTVWIDSSDTFATTLGLYTTANLNINAPDGYYSDDLDCYLY